MYPDAFTVERLANELNVWLKQATLKDIFSTSKSDLYFVFSNKKGLKIQFFQGQAFFQFPGVENFLLKNRIAKFPILHSQSISSIQSHPNSRSFEIKFENNFRLVFKLFGKFSNVILFDDKPIDMFCLNYQKDLQTPLSSFTSSSRTIQHTFNESSEFEKEYNWFGKDAISYLKNTGYFDSSEKELCFTHFTNQYLNSEVLILKNEDDSYGLSSFPAQRAIELYPKITDALNDFSKLYIASESFKIKKQSQISNLEKQIAQKQKLLNDLNKSIELIKQKRSYNQLGDLIMANLHSIHAGTKNVEVYDFYNDAKTTIKIKGDLSPQQNAALFYKKAKNEVKELAHKQQSVSEVEVQLNNLKKSLVTLIEADDTKKLRIFDKSAAGNNSITKTKETQPSLPYRHYSIDGFEVLVGKNSKANDELLSKYANKNDTWFHAKDVSGSHVIIKNHSAKAIPVKVIETVASLAAWYSKAKSNSLAAVIYTLRKYVRKPKGALPGQVIVERETGILVEPKDFLK
jgi:predicted ribosome quality control (RQC) complex YloA/Tae2 family protein